MTDKVASSAAPYPLALLLCDAVITDENSKKKTLVGVFDRIFASKFPTNYQPLTIYARLTDAAGTYEFRVDYVQVSKDKILAEGKITGIRIFDRLSPVEILLTPPPILIPEPGQYEFRIWANNRYVGRVGFVAEQKSRKKGEAK